jgi:hypothetical protein
VVQSDAPTVSRNSPPSTEQWIEIIGIDNREYEEPVREG